MKHTPTSDFHPCRLSIHFIASKSVTFATSGWVNAVRSEWGFPTVLKGSRKRVSGFPPSHLSLHSRG
jgi:hypothetical protein